MKESTMYKLVAMTVALVFILAAPCHVFADETPSKPDFDSMDLSTLKSYAVQYWETASKALADVARLKKELAASNAKIADLESKTGEGKTEDEKEEKTTIVKNVVRMPNDRKSGFMVSIYSSGGNAKKIVYLVDASASLAEVSPVVIHELKRSIHELYENQVFTVIFFKGDEVIEAPPLGFKQATEQNKDQSMQWIDPRSKNIVPAGDPAPLKAIQKALSYSPDLLFILAGDVTGKENYEEQQRNLLTAIEKSNQKATKINAIQILYLDKHAQNGSKGTLELISEHTGGRYRFINAKELGIQ